MCEIITDGVFVLHSSIIRRSLKGRIYIMAKRKAISTKTRFEVFKRDSFTCQYCGRKAPDAILEIDHIKPVSKDGDNDILNLTTSCWDCNSGKSDRLLSDNTVIEKQRKQLDELQERKSQIEMMLEWKMGLSTISEDESKKVIAYYNSKWDTYSLTDIGERDFRGFVKKYGAIKVIEAIDECYQKYGDLTREDASFSFVISRVKALLYYNSLTPEKQKERDQTSAFLRKAKAKFYRSFDYKQAVIGMNNFLGSGGTINNLNDILDLSDSFYDLRSNLNS